MFKYLLRKTKDGRLLYAPSILIRILDLVFAFLLIIGLYSVIRDEGFSLSLIFQIVFIIVLLIIPLYRDEWVFDNKEKKAICIFGIGPFVSKKEFSYEEIEQIEISHFYKGIADGSTAIKPTWRNKEMAALRIRMKGEIEVLESIEIVSAKREGLSLERTANAISSFTGLALEIDKPALEKGWR